MRRQTRGGFELLGGIGMSWMMISLAGCGGGQVPVPTSFQDYAAKNGAFSCTYPEGWEVDGGGVGDGRAAWAEFRKGPAKIRMDADVSGSLIADIARAGMGGMDNADAEPPVAVVHERNQRSVAESFGTYKEGKTRRVDSGIGEGRIADYTTPGPPLSSHIHGYRATFLTGNHAITVLCQCPADQWSRLRPTFDTVIKGLKR